MLAEVEGERGALPLLAFAAARLWERRDKESGLLTREAYQEIGGVAGALAQHAEATIDRIGAERIPIVRELFRNLVTAEGTRAVREWNELLSIFDGDHRRAGINPAPTNARKAVGEGFIPSRSAAEEVLRELIDARLLTSYEIHEDEQEPTRRVEIIHESLLANWPRLVRWQTQDADAAQLRDQLRQAAQDLGRARPHRRHAVDRLRLPRVCRMAGALPGRPHRARGGLRCRHDLPRDAAETAAPDRGSGSNRAGPGHRQPFVGTFWRRSVLETRRAEASKLLALAQVQIEKDPTEALAYATSSLELADSREARLFAVRALWAGPPVRVLDPRHFTRGQIAGSCFSPDGQWLAGRGIVNQDVLVHEKAGGRPIVLGGHAVSANNPIQCGWSRDDFLVTGHNSETRVRVWSMPRGDLVATIELGGRAWWQVGEQHLLAEVGARSSPPAGEPWPLKLVRWKLPDGEAEDLGTVDFRAVGTSPRASSIRGGMHGSTPRGTAYIPALCRSSKTCPTRCSAATRQTVLFVEIWGATERILLATTAAARSSCGPWTVGSWLPRKRMRRPEGVRAIASSRTRGASGHRNTRYPGTP